MPHKRIPWVDSAKGLGVIFVLTLHSAFPEPLRAVISAFAMMLFFWLSGFVFSIRKSDSFWSFLMRKIRTLMVPGILCAWIVCSVNAITKVSTEAGFSFKSFVCELLGVFINLRGSPTWNGVTWFLPSLFVIELCAYPCFKYGRRIWRTIGSSFLLKSSSILLLLLLMLGYVYGVCVHKALPWSVDIALEMSAFFGLGMVSRRYFESCDWSHPMVWSFSFVVLMVSSSLNYFIRGGVNPYLTHYGEFVSYLIAAISGILMSVGLSQFMQKSFQNSFVSKLLNYCGKHSIVFYLVNVSTYAFIPDLFSHVGLNVYGKTVEPARTSFVGNGLGPLTDNWFVLVIGGLLTLGIDLIVCTASAEFIDCVCPWILGKQKARHKK